MRDKNKKTINETDAAFAASMILTSFLLIAVVGAVIWLVYSGIIRNGEFDLFLPFAPYRHSS